MQLNVHRLKLFLLFTVACLLSALSPFAQADLVIDGFNAAEHDRFTNSPEFIGTSLGLRANAFSGIGVAFTPQGSNPAAFLRYGTLVSRNVILTSSHAPAVGEITFYPSNDPNSAPIVRNITSNSVTLEDSDLRASVLDAPVPAGFVQYAYATENFAGPPPQQVPTPDPNDDPDATTTQNQFVSGPGVPFTDSNGLGEVVIQVGGSPIDRSDSLENRRIDQAVGLNRVSGYIEDLFAQNIDPTNNDALVLIEELPGDDEFVDSESRAAGGDSGAPVFIQDGNGDLLLLGLNSVVGQINLNDEERFFTGVGFVGNRSDALDAFISANAVPEPATSSILGGLACLFLLSRRRQ